MGGLPGCDYAIVAHSERRQLFGERDDYGLASYGISYSIGGGKSSDIVLGDAIGRNRGHLPAATAGAPRGPRPRDERHRLLETNTTLQFESV